MAIDPQLSARQSFLAISQLVLDQLYATRQLTSKFGPVATISMPFRPSRKLVHISNAEYASSVYKNFKDFGNGGVIVASTPGSKHNKLRSGYFSANGEEYDHYVKKLGPHFKRSAVDEVMPQVFGIVREELSKWPTDQAFNFTSQVGDVLKILSSRCMFKDPDEPKGIHAANMVETHGRLAGLSTKNFALIPLFKNVRQKLLDQGEKTYDALVDWGETREGLDPSHDLLSTIVNIPTEKGCPISHDRLAGYGWTMLGATYDTSTSILSWLMLQLALHPQVLDNLMDELGELDKNDADYIQKTMNLSYLDAVINEALRLIPPAPIQRRKALRDTQINGHEITKGTETLLSAYMINRDPDIYPNPEIFDPSRWENLKVSPFQWPSFSAGPRRCLGIWFAYGFLKAILAELLSQYRPTIPDGTTINMKVRVTIRPDPYIPLILKPKHQKSAKPTIHGTYSKYLFQDN